MKIIKDSNIIYKTIKVFYEFVNLENSYTDTMNRGPNNVKLKPLYSKKRSKTQKSPQKLKIE